VDMSQWTAVKKGGDFSEDDAQHLVADGAKLKDGPHCRLTGSNETFLDTSFVRA
jgi:hypothetical protein